MSLKGKAADHSETGGVKSMSITGRFVNEKERTSGMTAEDRAWRKKWLQDQNLTPREPILINKNDPDLTNPIRRAYKKPLDVLFFKVLQPVMGKPAAEVFRFYTGKFLMGVFATYLTYYYFKYNTNNWERTGGWRVIMSRPAVLPGDEGYPSTSTKTKGSEYAHRDFHNSIFAKKIEKECAPATKPSGFFF